MATAPDINPSAAAPRRWARIVRALKRGYDRPLNLWDLTVLLATLFVAVVVPLNIVFGELTGTWVFAVSGAVTALFVIDILLRFQRPIVIDGRPVADRRVISRHYLSTWFTIDLLAAIPFGLIAMHTTVGSTAAASALRLLGLTRILRVARIVALQREWRARTSLNPAVLRLIFFLFWVFLLAHWIACGWIALGGPGHAHSELPPYLQALYWTISTLSTVGYGDVTPEGAAQVSYAIGVMALGVAMYGYVIGNVANLLANIDVLRAQHFRKMELMASFLREYDVPRDLQARVRDYYNYLWASHMGHQPTLFHDLPEALQIDIALHLNRHILRKVPVLEKSSESFLRALALHLEPVVFTPGDTILRRGEIGSRMYFIHRGKVEVLSPDGSHVVATLTDGDFFGELPLFTSQPRSASVRAADYCDLYSLDTQSFNQVLEHFPDFAEEVREIAEQRRAHSRPAAS